MNVDLIKSKKDLEIARKISKNMHTEIQHLKNDIIEYKSLVKYVKNRPQETSKEDDRKKLKKIIDRSIETLNILSKRINLLVPEYEHVVLSLVEHPTDDEFKNFNDVVDNEEKRCNKALDDLTKRLKLS